MVLNSTTEVIDALGGIKAVMALTGRSYNAVSNWKGAALGKFPTNTFLILNRALECSGHSAPMSLWGMPAEAEERAAS